MKRPRAALFSHGAIAQLVAHLLCKQRVAGSNPASSTIRVFREIWKPFFHARTAEYQRFQGIQRKQRMYGKGGQCQLFRYPARYPEWVPNERYWNHAHRKKHLGQSPTGPTGIPTGPARPSFNTRTGLSCLQVHGCYCFFCGLPYLCTNAAKSIATK